MSCDSWGSSVVPSSTSPTCSVTVAMVRKRQLSGVEQVQLAYGSIGTMKVGIGGGAGAKGEEDESANPPSTMELTRP